MNHTTGKITPETSGSDTNIHRFDPKTGQIGAGEP